MTAALVAATGDDITIVPSFSNAAQVSGASALWVDLALEVGFGQPLSDTEVTLISAFIATGKRVVFIADHNSWSEYRDQIHGMVGGSRAGQGIGAVSAVLVDPLTDGVGVVTPLVYGLSSGGTSLFNRNFATLWGPGNVLTIMDSNVFSSWGVTDNARFGENVAAWVVTPAVPEPSTLALIAVGGVAMILRRRRRT